MLAPSAVSRPLALALLASAVLAWLYGFIDVVEHAGSGMKYYVPMAEAAPGLDLTQAQPYVYRWLGPWLAGILPLPVNDAFYALAVFASLGLAALVYAVLRADGRAEGAAAATVALLATNPYLYGFNIYNPFHLDDILTQLGLGAALWLLWRGRYAWMGAVLALTVLTREPAILMVPVAAVFLWERGRLRADGARVALALVPLVVLFVAPRLLLPDTGGMPLAEQLAAESRKAFRVETWGRLLVNAWVPVVALLAVWPRETVAWAREHLHLVALFALVVASAFFGSDQERLMQPAIWVAYPAVAFVLDRRWRGRPVALGVLGVAALLTSLHHLSARFPLPDRRVTMVLSALALALAVAVSLRVRFRGEGREASSTRGATR